jgi:hypothetical protein
MIIKRLLLSLTLLMGLSLAASGSAVAASWNPFDDACQSGGDKSAVCQDSQKQASDSANGDPITGPNGLIIKIANVIAFVAGAAAVIIIILAGLRMVTSGGSSEDVAGARRALIYAAVGLAVISLSRIIVGFIIGSL